MFRAAPPPLSLYSAGAPTGVCGLSYAWGVVGHLMGVKNSDALRAAHTAMQPAVIQTMQAGRVFFFPGTRDPIPGVGQGLSGVPANPHGALRDIPGVSKSGHFT